MSSSAVVADAVVKLSELRNPATILGSGATESSGVGARAEDTDISPVGTLVLVAVATVLRTTILACSTMDLSSAAEVRRTPTFLISRKSPAASD